MSTSGPANLSPYLPALHPAKRIRTSQPRSGRKCDYCRHSKCKCLPVERDWSTGKKCDECVRKGNPCGPHRHHNDPVEAFLPLLPMPAPSRTPHQSLIVPQSSSLTHPPNSLSFTQPNTSSPLQRSDSEAQARFEGPNESEDPAIGLGVSAINPSWQCLPFTENTAADGQAAIQSFIQHFVVPNFSTFDVASRVRQGFQLLPNLLGLYQCLLSRRQEIARAAPVIPSRQFDDVDLAVDHHLALAYHDFSNALASQFDNIRSLNEVRKDLFRRLLDYPRKFFHHSNGQDKAFDHHGKKVEQTYAHTLQVLMGICTSEGDQDAADELALELAHLPCFQTPSQDMQSRISQALERQSERIHDLWGKLELQPKKDTVASVKGNVFPSQNLAIRYGLDWYSPSQTSPRLSPFPGDTIRRGALHLAVEHGNRELVRHLASKHRDKIDDRDVLSMTPFLLSALMGDLEILKILLKAGADPKAVDRSSRSALVFASEAGNDDIVRHLLQEEGFNPNEKMPLRSCTPLWAAASRGHFVTAEWLLKSGADLVERVQGKLPREIAEERRHQNLVKLLTAAGNRPGPPAPSRSSTAASAGPSSPRPSVVQHAHGQVKIADSPQVASQMRGKAADVTSAPNPRLTKAPERRISPAIQSSQFNQHMVEKPEQTSGMLPSFPAFSPWPDHELVEFNSMNEELLGPPGHRTPHNTIDGIG